MLSLNESFIESISKLDAVSGLKEIADYFEGKSVFTTSLGIEDQAITHIIAENKLNIKIVSLDTWRLFKETYDLWKETEEKYKIKIERITPDKEKVEKLERNKGRYSFYESIENRKECCHIRKVEPLNEALNNYKIWITGLRKEQSQNRIQQPLVEFDGIKNIWKYSPILEWNFDYLKEFVSENHVPYNPLHDKNYPSIGCEPCTRAIKPGEATRAGRWWWENEDAQKECGLHSK